MTIPTSSVLGDDELDVPSDGAAYDHWRKTGELPDTEEGMKEIEEGVKKEEESAKEETVTEKPLPEATSAEPTKKDPPVTTPAESGTAKPQPKKLDANARIRQLSEELRKTRELNHKLTEERLNAGSRTADPGVKRESPTATADTSKPASDANQEPQIDDKNPDGSVKYKTWGEFQKSYQTWQKGETTRLIAEGVDQVLSKRGKESEVAAAERVVHEAFSRKVVEASKKYSDFREVALTPDLQIPKGSPVEAYVLESENGADVLYYLGQHPEELERITGLSQDRDDKGNFVRVGQGMSPARLYRELSLIELSLLPDEEDKGKPASKPAAKTITQAPPPPKQITGKSPSTLKPVEEAVEADDTEAYIREANKVDVERRRARNARGR